MAKAPNEDDVLRRMLKTPPKPFTPKAKKKPSPKKDKAKKED
jgi:hypothetical protein